MDFSKKKTISGHGVKTFSTPEDKPKYKPTANPKPAKASSKKVNSFSADKKKGLFHVPKEKRGLFQRPEGKRGLFTEPVKPSETFGEILDPSYEIGGSPDMFSQPVEQLPLNYAPDDPNGLFYIPENERGLFQRPEGERGLFYPRSGEGALPNATPPSWAGISGWAGPAAKGLGLAALMAAAARGFGGRKDERGAQAGDDTAQMAAANSAMEDRMYQLPRLPQADEREQRIDAMRSALYR